MSVLSIGHLFMKNQFIYPSIHDNLIFLWEHMTINLYIDINNKFQC